MSNELERRIFTFLESPLKEKGFDLVEVTLKNGKSGLELALVVDRVEPIDLNAIVEVSNFVSALLDEEDPIEGAYTLDVSSLGAEKPIALEALPNYLNRYVNLHLSHPYLGYNIVEGTLLKIEDGMVHLSYKEKTRTKVATFPLKDVDAARLAIEF